MGPAKRKKGRIADHTAGTIIPTVSNGSIRIAPAPMYPVETDILQSFPIDASVFVSNPTVGEAAIADSLQKHFEYVNF
eukprot:IDg8508t1